MAFDEATAKNAREHNDAHVLTLGAGYVDETKAKRIVEVFLATECTVERHQRRVGLIDELDGGPRRSDEMTTGNAQSTDLVERIMQVLMRRPELLSELGISSAAGAPEHVCTTCNDCDDHCPCCSPDTVRALAKTHKGVRVRGRLGTARVPEDIAKLIDHTLLRADSTYQQVDQLCSEALKYEFASVCVNPVHVPRCAKALRGSSVKVCTVIGFPLGATSKENKAMEARRALRDGATELDMVINIGALKSGDHDTVYEDIRLVREVAHEGRALLKVIIETALLTDDEKIAACVLSKRARADFVKTSTGFSTSGATAADVALMSNAVEHMLEVKASGGVRSLSDLNKMVSAGATRIGASVGIKIAREARGEDVPNSGGKGY